MVGVSEIELRNIDKRAVLSNGFLYLKDFNLWEGDDLQQY